MGEKFKEFQLSEDEIKRTRRMLESEKIAAENLELQIQFNEQQIKQNLPIKNLQAQINDMRSKKETAERNIHALEKQIRNKKRTVPI